MEKKRPNVLVTGGNGQLGSALRAAAASSRSRFIFTDINEFPGQETVFLDVTNPEAIDIICDSEDIDVIINCAGYTNVEKAESEAVAANLLNGTVPGYLAATARRRKATLIHISTDYVFSGNASSPIPETATPAPVSVYGASKLAGEKAVLASGCKSLILRTAWMYSSYGKNFVKTMKALTAERPELKVVCDQTGTPTFADDLAAFILHVIDSGQLGKTGIYNFTNLGVLSWYDFAVAIRDLAGNGCRISPCMSQEFPQKATRPHYSVLDKSLVQKTFGFSIPYWYDSLKICMKQLGEDS